MADQKETIEAFVTRILGATQVCGAAEWFRNIRQVIDEWDGYLQLPAQKNNVEAMALFFFGQICSAAGRLGVDADRKNLAQEGRIFLAEMHREAIRLGFDVELHNMDPFSRVLA